MKFLSLLFLFLAAATLARGAEAPLTLRDAKEQQAWSAIAARFTGAPVVKNENAKTYQLEVTGLQKDPKRGGSAGVTVEKSSGHVMEVTANGAAFTDDEVAGFAAFPELSALILWHNSGGFTGASLAKLATLPKLERLTLAGGGLDDTGLAAAAKILTLKELRAWHARFSDQGIAALRGHPALESITIGPMWEPMLTDKTLEYLADCPKLKKLGLSETWLTWEHGLHFLLKRKDTLQEISLGNSLIEPGEVERLRKELPAAKVTWTALGTGREELAKGWIRPHAEAWIPKAMLDRAMAPAK